MARRRCIFCPNPANTKEHVWPKWVLAVVDQDRPFRFELGSDPEFLVSGEFEIGCVCGTCNHGWMSRLENEVKPFLEPILRGTITPLTKSVQTSLSHWAVKIAMVIEGARPKSASDRFYSDEDTLALREHRIIPDMTRVEAGYFADSGLHVSAGDFTLADGPNNGGRGHVSTIVVGHMVLQVTTLKPAPEYFGRNAEVTVAIGTWDAYLIDLWPHSKGRIWPPPLPFTIGNGPSSIGGLCARWYAHLW
jgi:hypothetical protein